MNNAGFLHRTVHQVLASDLMPTKFIAGQLRKPTGPFGRWLLAGGLNEGNRGLLAATLDALAPVAQERFLDVGFGGGAALRMAASRTAGALYGVDFSADMVLRGHKVLADLCSAGRLNLLTADVADLPLRSELVHTILTTNTIYFWPDLAGALAELKRVLAPGGRLALGYHGREKLAQLSPVTQHGFRLFAPGDLEEPLRVAGFGDVQTIALQEQALNGDFVTIAKRG